MVQTLDVNMVQTLVHLNMKNTLNSLIIKDLRELWDRTENPRVRGSIPRPTTLKPLSKMGGFLVLLE